MVVLGLVREGVGGVSLGTVLLRSGENARGLGCRCCGCLGLGWVCWLSF